MNSQQAVGTGALALFGRILLGAIFLFSAINKIGNWHETIYHMTSHGVPFAPVLLPLAVLLEVSGSILLLIGFKARLGALALMLFLIPVTLLMHNFWSFTGSEQQTQLINFMKNLAMLGGLMLTAAFGAGRLSVDAELQRRENAAAEISSERRTPAQGRA